MKCSLCTIILFKARMDYRFAKKHGKKLEMLDVVIIDGEATDLSPPASCRKPSAALLQRMG